MSAFHRENGYIFMYVHDVPLLHATRCDNLLHLLRENYTYVNRGKHFDWDPTEAFGCKYRPLKLTRSIIVSALSDVLSRASNQM